MALTIDTEEADRLLLTLDVFERVLAESALEGWNGFGIAVQSYQKRAAAVIVGLRAMLRRKETQREQIDLSAAVREVLTLLRSELLTHDVDVVLRALVDCPLVADRAQIQQVVFNLVTNAIEAVEGQPPERRRLEISLTHDSARSALLAIHDRGRGIPEEEQKSLTSLQS